MLAGDAKSVARKWVLEEAVKMPGVCGAFFHGSINWLPDHAVLSPHSDVDVMLVLEESHPQSKLGKFVYQDVLLEVSDVAKDRLKSAEMVLGQYHLAGSFQKPSVILDPSGELTKLQVAVAKAYAKRDWVRRRCQHVQDKILHAYRLDETKPLCDRVNSWVFPVGITTHMLLVAGLRNPTVRRRYVETHRLLADYGYLDFYEPLLDLLGCTHMTKGQVGQHLEALTEVFDVAAQVSKTPFFFSSDISEIARPIAIDGSWEMIEAGFHREAVFWMVATYSRCQKIIDCDGSVEMQRWASRGYVDFLSELGINSFSELRRRKDQVEQILPQVWEVAEAIMAANPEIQD